MKIIIHCSIYVLLIGKVILGLSQTQPTQYVCLNNTTTLQAPVGKSSYTWALPSSTVAQVMSGGTSTSSSVTLKWISGESIYTTYCGYPGGSMTWPVNVVNPLPSINGFNVVTGSCNTTAVTYTTPVTNALNYNWGVTGATSYTANGSSVTVNWPAGTTGGASKTGTVTLWYYTPSSPKSCPSRTASRTITINYPAPAIPTGNTNVTGCAIQTYTAPSSSVTWTVTGATNYQANGSTVQVLWPGTGGIGTVRYNIGCTGLSSPTLTINVNALPEPILNAQDAYGSSVDGLNLCYNNNSTVFDRVYYTTPGKVQYTWTGYGAWTSTQTGGLTNMGVNGIAHFFDGSTESYYKDISVRYFEPVGAPFNINCPSPTKTLRINLLPSSIATGQTIVCAPSLSAPYTTNDLTYNGVPHSNYFWSAVDGVVTSGQGTSSVNITWNNSASTYNPGSGPVKLSGVNLTYKNNALSCTSESVKSFFGNTTSYLPAYRVNIRTNEIIGQSPVIVNTAKSYQFVDASGSVTNSFVWNFNSVNTQTADNNVSITMPSTPGIYVLTGTYQLTNGNLNCTTTKSIDVRLPENCVGCAARERPSFNDKEQKEEESTEQSTYPNPAGNEIWITNYPEGSVIHFSNMKGETLIQEVLNGLGSKYSINSTEMPTGIYLLKISYPDGKQNIQKIAIVH